MRYFPQRSAGFTLLELLLALVLVAVLAILVWGGSGAIRSRSQQVRCVGNLRALSTIILQYSMERNGDLLPALGDANSTGGTPWYSTLNSLGILIGMPNREGTWNNQKRSIMTCPARRKADGGEDLPLWAGNSAGATLHYGLTQFPGFLNRIGRPGTSYETNYRQRYGMPKLARIEHPGRTAMLGEVHNTYSLWPNGVTRAYPHMNVGEGMNIAFYDGHISYIKGVLPDLGAPTQLNASDWEPEESYPFF